MELIDILSRLLAPNYCVFLNRFLCQCVIVEMSLIHCDLFGGVCSIVIGGFVHFGVHPNSHISHLIAILFLWFYCELSLDITLTQSISLYNRYPNSILRVSKDKFIKRIQKADNLGLSQFVKHRRNQHNIQLNYIQQDTGQNNKSTNPEKKHVVIVLFVRNQFGH